MTILASPSRIIVKSLMSHVPNVPDWENPKMVPLQIVDKTAFCDIEKAKMLKC